MTADYPTTLKLAQLALDELRDNAFALTLPGQEGLEVFGDCGSNDTLYLSKDFSKHEKRNRPHVVLKIGNHSLLLETQVIRLLRWTMFLR
jgi:hypothetical protein